MLSNNGNITQHTQDMLLFLVLAVNFNWFEVTRSYSSRPLFIRHKRRIVKCTCESSLPFLEEILELQKCFSFVCCLLDHHVVLMTVGRKEGGGEKGERKGSEDKKSGYVEFLGGILKRLQPSE